ncbi:MAG: DUF3105 domain-containing protein, partial [bacterium]|nr:DUF3105 domain-containing protein [bacterium]
MKWWHVVLVLLLGAGGFLLWTSVSSPPPGEKKEDQGREHVTPQAVDEFPYNSNPPTSGPHLPAWVKPGVFTEPKHDGELIHSLEHGYVIISYNCGVHLGQNPKSKAP